MFKFRPRKAKGSRGPYWRSAFLLIILFVLAGQGTALAKKQPPAKPIDINTATAKEFERLPGVGPTTAKAIVLFRTRSGRFRRVEDLLAVRGISEVKLKNMRPYIMIGAPADRTP